MKILFITKPFVIDPLGIAYLSASLKKYGHQTDLVIVESLTSEEVYNTVHKFAPDILAYSVSTGNHNFYLELNRNIRRWFKNRKLISVFGGPHCTFFPEIADEKGVDAVFKGECDIIFPNWVNNLVKSNVEGYKGNVEEYKGIHSSMQNPQDLDSLPFPDRELIYKYDVNRKNPIKNIMTSRGCPFKCPYCYNSIYADMFTGKRVRFRSIDSVIEEAVELKTNFPETKFIFFEDDEFVMKMERLREFSGKWKERVNLPFHAQLRVDLLTEERTKLLKDSGCVSVTFAIESGNDNRRMAILQRKISKESIYRGAKMLRKYGLLFRTENMICQPEETLEEVMETLDVNIKCKPTIAWSSIFQPYPKTPMGEECKSKGYYNGGLEDIPSSFFEKSVLNIPDFEKRQFENLQRLFGFVCSFPILRPFVQVLIKVPQNRVYDNLYKWWKNKKYDIMYTMKEGENGR